MSGTSNLSLPFGDEVAPSASRLHAIDQAGRERAVDPRFNVALEASAGTGKTRVLVDRYINLLRAGVDPSNILAITFTRKAAAEMRERILTTLRAAAAEGSIAPTRWRELRDRTADIGISTIDAFCLSLLREFPLEADLDPGFSLADETEVPRLIDASLDRALRICRALAREDDNVALVFAQLGDRRVRRGLAALLNRRLVAGGVLRSFLARGPRDLTVSQVTQQAARALGDVFAGMPGGVEQFLETGPPHHQFQLVARDLRRLAGADPEAVHRAYARVRELFLTQDGEPRKALDRAYAKAQFPTEARWRAFRDAVLGAAGTVLHAWSSYRRDLNVLVAHGTWRMYRVAEGEYRRTLDAHAVLDFSDVLLRALDLLRQMEEFAQSRFRLESRYHHVLVDEFQDTSRAQWELISLLVAAWGEGAGLAHSGPLPPSIFIVGDRKQSIYGFRDADVSLLQEAARHLEGLRHGAGRDGDVRRSISRSFRSVPPLLAFVNDVCQDIQKLPQRRDAFSYDEADRFPIDGDAPAAVDPALGVVAADTPEECARMTAGEIARLLADGATVRDRETGLHRAIAPGDIAILFRTRESHREFEEALDAKGIASYVYKGLGFFDADEIKDVLALLWYLAEPLSNLRAAAFLRSRFVKLSDQGLTQLAPNLATALLENAPEAPPLLTGDLERLLAARQATAGWRALVDRLPPAELLDRILVESAYAAEMRGPRLAQARENLKKLRALIRRIQNRGYSTLGRIAAHLDRLAIGDESNASIDALDAVSLMTVHAAKGLEFPVVFLVNLARGTGNRRDPIRVAVDPAADAVSVAIGDFQSDADEDNAAREREESKRLLYVALTRARDRLYLASALKDGRIQPGRGSLAEVLPATLLEHFGQARLLSASAGPGTPDTTIEWRATSGGRHLFRACGVHAGHVRVTAHQAATAIECDFEPLRAIRTRRPAVADQRAEELTALPRFATVRESDRLVGTVVHRLLQMPHLPADGSEVVKRAAVGCLRPDEVVHIEDADRFASDAARAYAAIAARSDVQAHYVAGKRLHEVPFSLRDGDTFVRGTIDCLIRSQDGGGADRVVVLEFKTGQQRPEHHAQLEVYARAARGLFPGASVIAELVYAE